MIQALITAGLWGGTDAFAGMSARRSTPLLSAIWLHVASIVLMVPFLIMGYGISIHTVSLKDLIFGVLAGIVAAIGDVFFGHALAKSSMTVGIPIANVIASVIPALVAIFQGESLTLMKGLGISGALMASALAVTPSNGKLATEGSFNAIIAGLCFGIMYGLLSQVHASDSLIVVFIMRCTGILALLQGMFKEYLEWKNIQGKSGFVLGCLSGVFSVGANWLFIIMMESGSKVILSIIAIALSAPIGMLIVNIKDREKLNRLQIISAGFAVFSIGLLAITHYK
jgi:drug/metabolite transporter (DMT)-like permease